MRKAVMFLFVSLCTDIRLLYVSDYREPTTLVPASRQTDPPSVPITKLYPEEDYPRGKEEPYTVSVLCGITAWSHDLGIT